MSRCWYRVDILHRRRRILSHQSSPIIDLIVAIVIIVKGIGESSIDLARWLRRRGSGVKRGRWRVGDRMREIVVIVVVSGAKVLLVLTVNLRPCQYILNTAVHCATHSFVSSGHDGLIVWRCRAASRIRLPREKDTRCRRKRNRLKRVGNEIKKGETEPVRGGKKERGSSRNDGERV